MDNTWAMETSRERLARADGNCSEGCQGKSYNCVFELLTNNGINPVTFAASLRDLLQNGSGKYRSIMIVRRANCGKTFMLSHLQALFKIFSNSENDKYALIGADEAECIFLNDFRWSNKVIP